MSKSNEMNENICVDFLMHSVGVRADYVFSDSVSLMLIQSKLPENIKDKVINFIVWDTTNPSQTAFNLSNGSAILFESTQENFNNYVKPFVDLWQAEKDRITQQTQEAQAEYNKFENRQARALNQLSDLFEQAKLNARVRSSLGFDIDANQTANENITGLLVTIGNGTTQFCDYNNQFHEVNKADLETIQTEIIQNAQYLYQQKWSYRTQIEECTDGDALDEILAQIEFKYKDFTQ